MVSATTSPRRFQREKALGAEDRSENRTRLAHSSPPVDLGSNIRKGSYLENGGDHPGLEKGLSIVDDTPCAVVEFDFGVSSFQMLMETMPGMEVRAVGSSHYFGDIYVDLTSRWPQKVDMRELVIAESKVPLPGNKTPMTTNTVMERQTVIMAVTKEAYERLTRCGRRMLALSLSPGRAHRR